MEVRLESDYYDIDDRLYVEELISEVRSVWNGYDVEIDEPTELEKKLQQQFLDVFYSIDPESELFDQHFHSYIELGSKLEKEGFFSDLELEEEHNLLGHEYFLRGLRRECKKFWKKHKKPIIVVAVAVTVIVVTKNVAAGVAAGEGARQIIKNPKNTSSSPSYPNPSPPQNKEPLQEQGTAPDKDRQPFPINPEAKFEPHPIFKINPNILPQPQPTFDPKSFLPIADRSPVQEKSPSEPAQQFKYTLPELSLDTKILNNPQINLNDTFHAPPLDLKMPQNTWVSSGPAESFQYPLAHLPLDAQAPTQLMTEIATALLTPERRPLTASEKIEFGAGVLYGIPQGVYASGKDLAHFAGELIVHPLDTAYNVASAIWQLYELGKAGQWDLLKEALVPEVFELAKEWDTLTIFEQGEKSSIIISKYSADFLIPGSLVKVVGKSTKLAAELIHIEQQLAKMPIGFAGQGAAFAARETGILAEEFGVVAKEAGALAEAGLAEKAARIGVKEFLPVNLPSGVEIAQALRTYQIALDGGKHFGFLKNNLVRSKEELMKGISSLEKQIKLHQDKIANPGTHIENWIDLDPRRQEALIKRIWPSDIERQVEQRDILQIILSCKE